MKKVKIQSKISWLTVLLLSVAVIIVFGVLLFIVFSVEGVSTYTQSNAIAALALAAIFIPMWFRNTNKEEYASDLFIDDEKLVIVYKKQGVVREQTILLTDITKVEAEFNANVCSTRRSSVIMSETFVDVWCGDVLQARIAENPGGNIIGASYDFMLRLLSISNLLPNFSYKLSGNAKFDIEQVKYFAQNGKKMPIKDKVKCYIKNTDKLTLFAISFCILAMFVSIGYSIYLNLPAPALNNVEQEFMAYYNAGHKLWLDKNDYKGALQEFDKAQTVYSKDYQLYIEKAYCYEFLKDYSEAVDMANEALKYSDKQSVWRKANRIRGKNDREVSAYEVIGRGFFYLKQYKEAKEAFTQVIKLTSDKYTKAYLWRGGCEYYLGEKENALKDFFKHKNIINEYLDYVQNMEYKMFYSTYTNKDLIYVEKWIQKCGNL